MRFMMLMIPRVYQHDTPADFMPPADAVEQMSKYNSELQKAGVLLSLDGLQAPAGGARVRFGAGAPTITDGPFTESREIIGGYWIISVKSQDEAVEWARRCPAAEGDMIEVRRVYDLEDFPADVQAVAKF